MRSGAANSAAANEWARKKKEAMERAARLKAMRKAGGSLDGEGDGPDPPAATGRSSRPVSSRTTAIPEPSPSSAPDYQGSYATLQYSPQPEYQQDAQQGYAERSLTSTPSYGRRAMSREAAEHMFDEMPALDMKPVRVRRPPSSSRIHSQGQPTETLDMVSDWSSPVKTQHPGRATTQLHEHAAYPEYEPTPQYYDRHYSSTYNHGAAEARQSYGHSEPQERQQSHTKGPSTEHLNRSRRPEWNSEFTETDVLEANDAGPHQPEPSAPAHHAPRAGRRATPPSKARRPEWNSEFDESSDPHDYPQEDRSFAPPAARVPRKASATGRPPAKAPAQPRHSEWNSAGPDSPPEEGDSYLASVEHRAASRPGSTRGLGLEKLKKMSLRRAGRTNSGPSPSPGQRLSASAGICRAMSVERPSRTTPRQEQSHHHGPSPDPPPYRQTHGYGSDNGMSPEKPREYADAPVQLIECNGCGRKFNQKALTRHANICAKVFQDKRKPMDMSKQRVGGTEAAKHFRADPADAAKPSPIKQAALERRQGGGRVLKPAASTQPARQSYQPSEYEDPDPWGHERQGGAAPTRQQQPSRRKPARAAASPQRSHPEWQDSEPTHSDYSDAYGPGAQLSGGGGGSAPGVDAPEFAPQGHLTQCRGCGRKFNDKAYAKHSKICAKVFQEKRKPVDMTSQRVAGTDAAKFVHKARAAERAGGRQSARAGARPPPRRHEDQAISTKATNQPKWKQQSQGLRAAMANNRQIKEVLDKGGNIRDIPMVPSAPDASLVPCPHCGRRYNETAAERHIPKCKDIIAKPKFLSRNGGKGAYARKPSAGVGSR